MTCPHYKGGATHCAICIQNLVLALQEEKRLIDRKIRELLIKLGEEPQD